MCAPAWTTTSRPEVVSGDMFKLKRLTFVSSSSTLDDEYYVRHSQEIGTAEREKMGSRTCDDMVPRV